MESRPTPPEGPPGKGRARGRTRMTPTPGVQSMWETSGSSTQAPPSAASSVQERETSAFSSSSPAPSTVSSSSFASGGTLIPSSTTEGSGSTKSESIGRGSGSVTSSVPSYAPESGAVKTRADGWDKAGKDGMSIDITTNYYPMNKNREFRLYQFRVDFTPVEDNTTIKKSLVRQHEETLGKYVFDGSIMYKTRWIEKEKMVMKSQSSDGTEYEIRLRLVGQLDPTNPTYLQFYNIVIRKCMSIMGMEELGRNMYDRNQAVEFKDDKLELWPGFITAICHHEAGPLLCVEVTHKVLRTSNVWDFLLLKKHQLRTDKDYHATALAELEDSIVMTLYNRRTYTINSIAFDMNPTSKFRGQDGSVQSYVEYYKRRYGIEIKNLDQPLLISKPRKKDINKGITGDIYLIPELCHPTGLSDEMRKNFQLMKRLSGSLHMSPQIRQDKMKAFMQGMGSDIVKKELEGWGIDFDSTPVSTQARVLPRQSIIIGDEGKDVIAPDDKGDWTNAMKGKHLQETVAITRWCVFVPPRERDTCKNFLQTMKQMADELGVKFSKPLAVVDYDINRTGHVELDNKIKEHDDVEFVMFILPNNQLKRYAQMKNYATLVLGIPSQCFLAKNLTHRSLRSIASKVMIQITAKMGGVPWSVKMPSKKLMVLGFDVYHCAGRKGESAGALVATRNPELTQYTSLVSFHKDKSELANNMCEDTTKCLHAYAEFNKGSLPERIFMFRDGVGAGQIEYVLGYEVAQMRTALQDVYSQANLATPKLTFTIVTKKINTRAFLKGRFNVPVGTVLDQAVTLPERYDFFLVSQDVRQGTASPTDYNVIVDDNKMTPDQLQALTYKLTHLYYNWSGTVAVPAPCQYAHKLAYITGEAVGEKAKPELNTKLWYL